MARLTDDDRKILDSARLFDGVPRKMLDDVLVECRIQELEAKEVLLSPDIVNHYIYLVLSGSLEVHIGDTAEEPLAKVNKGECVGEMSVLDSQKPSARVIAAEPTRVLELHQAKVWQCIDATEGMARNLLYILSDRLRVNTTALLESLKRELLFERFANMDALTELHNRRGLDHALDQLIGADDAKPAPLTLILLDIDFFKRYNDSHGHPAGDSALRQVAKAVAENLRPSDMAARYGGEEFAVVLPDTGLGQGRQTAQRLCSAVRNTALTDAQGQPLPPVTISLGVAQHRPGETKQQLLQAADAALYRAKQQGRDRAMI